MIKENNDRAHETREQKSSRQRERHRDQEGHITTHQETITRSKLLIRQKQVVIHQREGVKDVKSGLEVGISYVIHLEKRKRVWVMKLR